MITKLIHTFWSTATEEVLPWAAGGLGLGTLIGLGYLFAQTHGWLG